MTKTNVFSNKEMTIEFCHIQVYINIKTNSHDRQTDRQTQGERNADVTII